MACDLFRSAIVLTDYLDEVILVDVFVAEIRHHFFDNLNASLIDQSSEIEHKNVNFFRVHNRCLSAYVSITLAAITAFIGLSSVLMMYGLLSRFMCHRFLSNSFSIIV